MLAVFLSLEAVTLVAWIWIFKVYPFLVTGRDIFVARVGLGPGVTVR